MLLPGRVHRGVPAGGRTDAGAHALPGPGQLRRHRRPRRPVPPRAHGGEHAQRLRRPQERAEAGHLPPPRPGGDPGRHLRADDLPGVGHAGGPEGGGLLPGRGRQPAQGLRQEDPGDDPGRAGQVRRRLRDHGLRPGPRRPALRHHRALRRLRLQQEPRLRLRPHRLPDGLAEGPLPGRVPRRPADLGQGQPGQGRHLPGRVPDDGHRGPGARHQPVGVQVHRGAARGRRRPGPWGRSPSGCPPCATWARG